MPAEKISFMEEVKRLLTAAEIELVLAAAAKAGVPPEEYLTEVLNEPGGPLDQAGMANGFVGPFDLNKSHDLAQLFWVARRNAEQKAMKG